MRRSPTTSLTTSNTPDIIGLQEIQDNSGSEMNDGTVFLLDENLQLLVDAYRSCR